MAKPVNEQLYSMAGRLIDIAVKVEAVDLRLYAELMEVAGKLEIITERLEMPALLAHANV